MITGANKHEAYNPVLHNLTDNNTGGKGDSDYYDRFIGFIRVIRVIRFITLTTTMEGERMEGKATEDWGDWSVERWGVRTNKELSRITGC